MAGVKGRSGPPNNVNAFKHGLSALSARRETGALTEAELSIRQEILEGLIQDKGGKEHVSTATAILAEVIASDAAWLTAFNKAIDAVMQHNQRARQNPKALATLDGYKRALVNSLTANLSKFGFERIVRTKTLQEIIDSMPESDSPAQDGTTESSESIPSQPPDETAP